MDEELDEWMWVIEKGLILIYVCFVSLKVEMKKYGWSSRATGIRSCN